MAISGGDATNSVLLDEERIKRESARVELKESAELAGVAHELKQKSAYEAVEIEHDLGRGRTAAQVVDYIFYLIYGLIALQFVLALKGARPGNGFVQFITDVTRPLFAPFERIEGAPSAGAYQIQLSCLLALVLYIMIHLAIDGVLRLIAHRAETRSLSKRFLKLTCSNNNCAIRCGTKPEIRVPSRSRNTITSTIAAIKMRWSTSLKAGRSNCSCSRLEAESTCWPSTPREIYSASCACPG